MSHEIESPPVATEFRRVVDIGALGNEEVVLAYSADSAERTALASRFSILSLDRLDATARVRRLGRTGARARVNFSADVVQSCVVTLEPVASRIDEAFELNFLPAATGLPPGGSEAAFDPGEGEPPGDVIDGTFDLGAVIAEYLSLSIDPYPRKPGAVVETLGNSTASDGEAAAKGPFSALEQWRGKA